MSSFVASALLRARRVKSQIQLGRRRPKHIALSGSLDVHLRIAQKPALVIGVETPPDWARLSAILVFVPNVSKWPIGSVRQRPLTGTLVRNT
jgi:hypothetical protein